MEHRFRTSRFTRGNVVFPTEMVVTDRHVSRIKPSLVGSIEESISLRQVSSVTVSHGALFADVTVHSSGGTDPLRSHGLTNAEARRLKELIEELQSNILSAGVADLSGLRPCPRCAETIKAAAQVCKHCGADIPIVLTEEAPPEPVAEPADTFGAERAAGPAAGDDEDWTWS
ncbi:MAG: hypothetical protein IT293_20770 [Deltaproteobacteria bacterium]|nr:hypothetical protein [Deltaproteobacteria bacterium]